MGAERRSGLIGQEPHNRGRSRGLNRGVPRRIQFAPDGGRFAALVGEARFVTTVSIWDIAADRELHKEWTDAGNGRGNPGAT